MSTALLVVDAQNGLLTGASPVYDADGLVGRIQTVLVWARNNTIPVVFTQDKDVGPIDSDEWQIHSALALQPEEIVFPKAYADSFYQTPLHTHLTQLQIQHLVVVGCTTNSCVEMTCRRAVSLGYDVTLVSDGHSTSDNCFLTAPQSIEYYNIILDGFGAEDGFGEGKHEIRLQSVQELVG